MIRGLVVNRPNNLGIRPELSPFVGRDPCTKVQVSLWLQTRHDPLTACVIDLRDRSPRVTPKYPLQRGQIRAIFRDIENDSFESFKKAGGVCTPYRSKRQEKDPSEAEVSEESHRSTFTAVSPTTDGNRRNCLIFRYCPPNCPNRFSRARLARRA